MPDITPLKVAMSGANGLIGSALGRRLRALGHRVTPLVRRPAHAGEISWDPTTGRLDPDGLEGLDVMVHLAGENVGVRWTRARKTRIRSSRVQGTQLLSQALAHTRKPPRVLVSASAMGIYGNRGEEILTERSPPGPQNEFLAGVGMEWENAATPARTAGIRVVHPRFGVVLSPDGGALAKMLPPFRLGLGGRLGRGTQWMSWISIDDVAGALLHLILNDNLSGAVNVTSPEPVRNRDFTRTLGRVLSRPAVFPVPSATLRLVFGEMADAALLASARVLPERLLGSGYRFAHPDLETALRHVLGQDRRAILPE